MRTEIHDRQLDITVLNTELAKITDPNCELRSHKAGRLYAKSGARHADGRSRSRLAYQAGGADYLSKSIIQSLRDRKVRNAAYVCKNIMDAARPELDRTADEPNRFRVRHARTMARMIELAEMPEAAAFGFEAAALMVADQWLHLARLDDKAVRQWWTSAVHRQFKAAPAVGPTPADDKAQPKASSHALTKEAWAKEGIAGDEALQQAWFESKDQPGRARLVQSPPSSEVQRSSAQADREARITWHERPKAEAVAERKYGPGNTAVVQSPASRHGLRVDTSVGRAHNPAILQMPVADRVAEQGAGRARGFVDNLLGGDLQLDGLVASLRAQDIPHLMPVLRKQADGLMVSATQPRDSKALAQDQRAWARLGRFCGEAVIDDGLGEHAFTREQVLQFPANQRLNMLEAVADEVARSERAGIPASAEGRQDAKARIYQLFGLMSAFGDAELLPPSDEVRVKALRARVQAIVQGGPGGGFTPAVAEEIVKAHREVYPVNAKPPQVRASATLKQPFAFSLDRSALYVSVAPRPQGEQPAEVMRQLLSDLARDYQRHLVLELNLERLQESDDRYMLAVTLAHCQPPAVDMELLGSGFERPVPAGAPTRHAALHARLALGQ